MRIAFATTADDPTKYSARQTEILDVLEALFLENGFRALSVADLTTAAHCSRATLYDLAPTKEELFLLVLERMLTRIHQRGLDDAAELADPVAKIETYLTGDIETLGRVGAGFTADTNGYRPAARILLDYAFTRTAALQQFIDEGVDQGVFPGVDSAFAAQIMMAMARQVASPQFQAMTGRPWTESIRACLKMLLYGLVGEPKD